MLVTSTRAAGRVVADSTDLLRAWSFARGSCLRTPHSANGQAPYVSSRGLLFYSSTWVVVSHQNSPSLAPRRRTPAGSRRMPRWNPTEREPRVSRHLQLRLLGPRGERRRDKPPHEPTRPFLLLLFLRPPALFCCSVASRAQAAGVGHRVRRHPAGACDGGHAPA